MKLHLRILALVLVFAGIGCFPAGKWDFDCPDAHLIRPCSCSSFPRKIVRCEGVRNLAAVRKALGQQFSEPLPWLYITNIHSFSIPYGAFRNISARRLVLNGSNIRRIHDDAFENQDSLGLLVLSEDRLTDVPTEALKRLPGLRSLSLAGNFLMKLTDHSFENLDNLVTLILVDNRLSQIERNAFPRRLQSLSIARNHLSTLNGTLNYLNELDTLYASGNRLVSVKGELEGLTQLRHLSLDKNKLRDVEDSFKDLTSLQTLSLSYNRLKNIGKELYHLRNLQHLNLSYNYITELDEELFKHLNKIQTLDLSGNYLRDVCSSLKHLKNLRELILSDTNLDSLDFDCFKGMRDLVSLDLSHNQLTNIDAITGHSFPNLLTLNLQDNKLLSLKYSLKNLKALGELDISNNGFTSIKRHHLMHNKRLYSFKVGDNPWECTDHLVEILNDLEARDVDIVGKPYCYLSENTL
ncbi:leucine-rich repeat-containing protein 15-like [Stegodyphus dumicola]|uniref:leucine-rich repeat-containing protein 15-like n=1 Tax=Stegodyphus dumicola TaxID=202533 RepID=UPI0015B283B0|nr:leucine-rich repeat-containing protein 15-like [Stegodyphus dumicola]